MHITDVFKIVNVFKVYEESFLGGPNETTWPQYEGDTLCHNDNMGRKKKGLQNSSQIRTEWTTLKRKKEGVVFVAKSVICSENVQGDVD